MNTKIPSAAICRCRTVALLRYALAALLCATRLDAFAEDGITELGSFGGGISWSGDISADGSVVVGGSMVGGTSVLSVGPALAAWSISSNN